MMEQTENYHVVKGVETAAASYYVIGDAMALIPKLQGSAQLTLSAFMADNHNFKLPPWIESYPTISEELRREAFTAYTVLGVTVSIQKRYIPEPRPKLELPDMEF